MKRAALLAAAILAASATPAVATTPPTPHIFAVFPGQKVPATTTYYQDSVWIGVVFSDVNYGGDRLNLYLTPASAVCQDFNKAPAAFYFDTVGDGSQAVHSSYWWAWHASSYGSTGKANCNRSRVWANNGGGYVDSISALIPNFKKANDNTLWLQIGRVG